MKLKRILSLLTVMAMLLSCVGITAMAEENVAVTVVTAEADLSANLVAGGSIKLGGNIEVFTEIKVPAGVTATLDLAGYSITSGYQEDSTTKHIYPINNYGTLTIEDSSSEKTGSISGRGIYVQDGSKLTVVSGAIYGIDSNGGSALYQYGGDIVINGGRVEQKAEGTSNFAINAGGGTVTVNGGWIGGNHGAIAAVGATVVINDGELVCTGSAGMTDNVLYTSGTGTITINGGTFVGDNESGPGGCCVYDVNGGATINGGNFSNSSGGDVWGTTGTVINGGTFEELIETSHVAVGATITNGGVTYVKTESGFEVAPDPATISSAQINMDDTNEVFISAEISGLDKAPATESVVIKTYSDETLVATTTLANTGYFSHSPLGVKICLTGDSSSWNTAWEEGMPRADVVPDKNVLYVDGAAVSEAAVPMIRTGGEAAVNWADLPGVYSAPATPQGKLQLAYTNANYDNSGVSAICGEAINVVAKESFVVKLYSGETLVGTATLVDNDKVLLNGISKTITWHAALADDGDSWWSTKWEGGALNVNALPDTAVLWVDGVQVDTCNVELNIQDREKPVVAAVTDEDGNVQSFVAGTGYLNGQGDNAAVYDEALQTAISAGGNIVLLRDVTLTKVLTVPAGKTVNLDLNGKTITNNVVNNRIFHVYADFTIDGTDEGSSIVSGAAGTYGVLSIEADCAVTLNGGSYTGSTTGASGAKGGIIKAIETSANGAELTLNNVNVETNNWIIDSPAYLDSLTITGGTYATNGVGITAVINQNGTATLTDVAVTSGSGPAVELSGYSTSTATLSGCALNAGPDTVNAYGTGGTALCVVSGIVVNVEGGSYTGTTYAAGITTSGKTLNIKGGEFNGAIASHNNAGTVTIEGGNFTNFAVNTNGSTGKVAISGGTFDADVSDYCVDGFVATKNADGTYGIIVKPELPTATVTEISEDELTAGNAPELTFSKRFTAVEPTELQNSYYGDWFADFVLTVNKDVTFNANGSADGYLAGQYDAWSESWISVPFENVTMKAGESLKIMEYAAQLMGKPDLKVTYYDVANFVKVFDCGVFFDEEFLAANPDLKVTLELRMYNPEDETESYAIGETYEFTAEELLGEEPYIFGTPFYMINLPMIDNQYQVSLYSGIDSLKYKEVGFKVYDKNDILIGQSSTDTVYTSIKGSNMTIKAEEYNMYRIFGVDVFFGTAWDGVPVYFRPYAVDLIGKEISGKKYKIEDIYTSDAVESGETNE